MRWVGHAAHMGEERNVCKVLAGKLEGNGPLGRLKRRWKNMIKWIFVRLAGRVWIGFT
jgi:hypothetical protein